MNLLQILLGIYFAFLGAYLSVLMGRVLRQNGRVLKKMDEGFTQVLEKMDEGFKLIARLIVEENERARKDILEALKK